MGTTVVVTGGARGIGLEMSRALAGAGASVLIVDIDEEPIDQALHDLGGTVEGHRADVSLLAEVDGVVRQARERFGHLDVVINNAGINLRTITETDSPREASPFYDLGPLAVRGFFEVHVMAPFLLARAAVGAMLEQGFGRIVTVTTSLDTMLRAKGAPYGPMKAASEAFTSNMAQDLAGTPVTANVLVPGGAVATRFVGDVDARPAGAFLEAAIMGPPAVWLASRASGGANAMRFVASRWDSSRPTEEAALAAGAPIGWPSDRTAPR